MNITDVIIFAAIGALAGWQTGTVMRGGGFGLQLNVIIGIIGGVAGAFLFRFIAISAGGFIGSLLTAILGAVLLLVFMRYLKRPANQ